MKRKTVLAVLAAAMAVSMMGNAEEMCIRDSIHTVLFRDSHSDGTFHLPFHYPHPEIGRAHV